MTERNTKCDKWLTEEGLTLLSAWARDGLTDENAYIFQLSVQKG